MAKVNTWYVIAKKDKRYKYNFITILDRSHVFKSLKKAHTELNKYQKKTNSKLVILKRTCEVL